VFICEYGVHYTGLIGSCQLIILPVEKQVAKQMAAAKVSPTSSSQNHPTIIRLQQVVKDYLTPSGAFRALHGIDLEIGRGEFVAIIGKSGAGKTTLINMMSGVDQLTSGDVLVDGIQIHQLKEHDLAAWRGKNLGIVFQSFFLLPGLNLLDNVMLPMDFCSLFDRKASPQKAARLLAEMGLEEHLYKLPGEISGGQQQRVAIARALINDPPVILADEPTGRLDSITAEKIFEVFQSLSQRGKTIVMVTHDQSLAKKVHRTIRIQDGEVVDES
jgi:putative ABC transport system ATP-binding protein